MMEHEGPNGSDFSDMNTAVNGLSGAGGNINNNDAKRVKLDTKQGGSNAPSRVIHIRNIPSDVTEAEVIHLGIPFGRVTNVLVLKGKNQAFLEMEEELSAAAMVNYFTNCAATLRERSVYVQFSNHRELKTDQTHSNASASAQAALQAAQALSGSQTNGGIETNSGGKFNSNHSSSGANTVLRVIVEHMVYPVTLDVIYQIFSRVGKVLKIVTFTKNNSFQVLIQYPDVITAQAAKLSLDNQNIYNGCCTLRIEYSKLSNLNVKYNNDKSRDYTNPGLPTGDHAMDTLQSGLQNAGGGHGVLGSPFLGLGNPLAAYGTAGLTAASMSGLTGFPLGGGGGSPFTQSALRFASAGGAGAGGLGGNTAASLQALGVGNQLQAAVAAAQGGSGSVLLVSNLNEDQTECDHLFTLFGVYGDVHRVKILFNKKDTALIQMSEPQQAILAMTHLDKVKLWGKPIRVMPSKHTSVQLPKEGQPDAGLTKDYSASNLHRFKKPGSKNYSNIYPPSSTLHLSNIPASVEETDLKEAFLTQGLNVQAFKFFPKDRKMALVQLGNVEDAIAALVKLHNYQLSETSHLRVSFSKSTI